MTPEQVFEQLRQNPDAFRRVPVSTYRVQLDRAFGFQDLSKILPYLSALGITDSYLSPFFQTSSDRSHGYDISDHNRFNSALGTETDYQALVEAIQGHGMGQIIDVVPNHMGITGSRNAWWMDVLENGPASPYAPFFDIDWDPVKPELKNKVLLPILGDQYGRVLENQELLIEFQEGAFFVRYYDTLLPVAPCAYAEILRLRMGELEEALGKDHPSVLELQSILTALGHLPSRTETDPERLQERNREKQIIKRRLDVLTRESPEIKLFVQENVRLFNGTRGEPESFDRLDELLNAQAYRLAFWQVAADEINYRRFFDINELAAIRMEDPAVFEDAHRLIFALIRRGDVTGLRIDHPDGLYAPAQYFRNLQRRCLIETARRLAGVGEDWSEPERKAWEDAFASELERPPAAGAPSPYTRPFYVVAEKILMRDERLPQAWPVHGTTGYEFLSALNGIFVHSAGERMMTDTYSRFLGVKTDFHEVVYETKKLIMDTSMSSEITILGHRLARISEKHRASRDFTDKTLTDALREIIACFPVYRTYVAEDGLEVTERDRRYIEQAAAGAKRRNPTTSASVYDFIRDLLCLRYPQATTEAERQEHLTFAMKFQQLTSPIMAKGLEDTAFYRYNRLVSLNEVGGSPDRFGIPLSEFHQHNADRLAAWPWSLCCSSTHDTKRGEDVRARLNVLSEIPQEWRFHLNRWHRLNRDKKTPVDGRPAPDPNEEYLLYQTLIGAWPFEPGSDAEYADFVERIQQYMSKALREAKVHASWVNPDPDYDAGVHRFVAAILDRSGRNRFLRDFLPFQRKLAGWGIQNSLSQTLVRLAAPGVPDTYQGSELWDLTLVDPDNRRPVDYARRRAMLDQLDREAAAAGPDLPAFARDLVKTREDGRIKLYLVSRLLRYRRQHAPLFRDGSYLALEAEGAHRDHVCAFARETPGDVVVAVAPRFPARLRVDGVAIGKQVWADTRLVLPKERPGRLYRSIFTGEEVQPAERAGDLALPLDGVFATFPVALLEQIPEAAA